MENNRLGRLRRPCDRVTVGHEHFRRERAPRADLADPFLIAPVDLASGEKALEAFRGAVDYVRREAVPNVRVFAMTPAHHRRVVAGPMPVLDDAVRKALKATRHAYI